MHEAHLFAPAPAYRAARDQNKDTPPPAETALGTNPPIGAVIDYSLAESAREVVIEIRDCRGASLRRFVSNDAVAATRCEAVFLRCLDEARARLPEPQPARTASSGTFAWRDRRRSNTTTRSPPCWASRRRWSRKVRSSCPVTMRSCSAWMARR